MQGTWVQSLVQEDSTFQGAANPLHHNYWNSCAPEPVPPQQEKSLQWEDRTPQLEKSLYMATKTQNTKKRRRKKRVYFQMLRSRGIKIDSSIFLLLREKGK